MGQETYLFLCLSFSSWISLNFSFLICNVDCVVANVSSSSGILSLQDILVVICLGDIPQTKSMVGKENMSSEVGEKWFPSIRGRMSLSRQSVRKIEPQIHLVEESLADKGRTSGALHLVRVIKLLLRRHLSIYKSDAPDWLYTALAYWTGFDFWLSFYYFYYCYCCRFPRSM